MTPQEQLDKVKADLVTALAQKAAAEQEAATTALDASLSDPHRVRYDAVIAEVHRLDRDITRLRAAITIAEEQVRVFQEKGVRVEEPPRYRLLRPTTNSSGEIVPAGIVIEFHGTPNEHMQPTNSAAEAAVAAWQRRAPRRRA